jgi:YVTN family beta-propeller protein
MTGDAYIADYRDSNVAVVNETTNRTVSWIPITQSGSSYTGPGGPDAALFDPLNGNVYVADYEIGQLTVINGFTHRVTGNITVGGGPVAVAVDNATGYLYVSDYLNSSVTVINGATNKVVTSITGFELPHSDGNPTGITFDPTSSRIYVAVHDGGAEERVFAIATASNTAIGSVPVGSGPLGMAYDYRDGRVFVTNWWSNNLTILDGQTGQVIGEVPTQFEQDAVAYDSANGYLYVGNYGADNLTVVSGANGTVIDEIEVGPGISAVAFDNQTGNVYASNGDTGEVMEIDGATDKVVQSLNVWHLNPSSPSPSEGQSDVVIVYITLTSLSAAAVGLVVVTLRDRWSRARWESNSAIAVGLSCLGAASWISLSVPTYTGLLIPFGSLMIAGETATSVGILSLLLKYENTMNPL